MQHKMSWMIRGLVALALVAVTVTAIALTPGVTYAQDDDSATTDATQPFGRFGMFGRMGDRMFGHMGGMFGFGLRGQDDAPLAEALGITTEELQAARDQVFADELAAAVEAGTITQEEADELLTQRDLHRFLADRLQNAYTDAINAAVEEGIITQEQADEYLDGGVGRMGAFGGMMGGHMMGGRGMRGHGMMDGMMDGMMNRGGWSDDDETPGRMVPRGGGRMMP